MSEPVTHLDVSCGLDMRTACNRSLHGWNLRRPKRTTTDRREATCKPCLKASEPPMLCEVPTCSTPAVGRFRVYDLDASADVSLCGAHVSEAAEQYPDNIEELR